MKKWLKSGICGSVNNAFVHCSRLTWSNNAAEKKKKKKELKRDYKTQTRISTESKQSLYFKNHYEVSSLKILYKRHLILHDYEKFHQIYGMQH